MHYEHNKELRFSGYINNQMKGADAEIKMGTTLPDSSNACGWVAAYNAFVSMGRSEHPANLVRYIETHNGLIADGVFGVNPSVYDSLFSYFGYTAKTTFAFKDDLDKRAKAAKTAILCYINKGGITNGAHYINIKWDSSIGSYNAYNNVNDTTIASITDYIKNKTDGFISLTVIG